MFPVVGTSNCIVVVAVDGLEIRRGMNVNRFSYMKYHNLSFAPFGPHSSHLSK